MRMREILRTTYQLYYSEDEGDTKDYIHLIEDEGDTKDYIHLWSFLTFLLQ